MLAYSVFLMLKIFPWECLAASFSLNLLFYLLSYFRRKAILWIAIVGLIVLIDQKPIMNKLVFIILSISQFTLKCCINKRSFSKWDRIGQYLNDYIVMFFFMLLRIVSFNLDKIDSMNEKGFIYFLINYSFIF